MLRLAELCMGYGGLGMGLEMAGVDCELTWCAEIDPHASKVIAHHWPNVPNLGDLTKITDPPPVDIVAAGFPCTDISLAGRRAGLEGEHSGIWWNIANIIDTARPGLVVLENVSAILANGGPEVIGSLADMGYDARWGVVRASAVGALHHRPRWFAVAYPRSVGRRPWAGLCDSEAGGKRRAFADNSRSDHPGESAGRSGPERVARWASVVGRSAPPVGERARFREWLMGLPDGHVTRVPGDQPDLFGGSGSAIPDAEAVRLTGNGVVPQQAAEAIRRLVQC